MTNPKEVFEKFKEKKKDLKDWLYGTVYKCYDKEDEAEVMLEDMGY